MVSISVLRNVSHEIVLAIEDILPDERDFLGNICEDGC